MSGMRLNHQQHQQLYNRNNPRRTLSSSASSKAQPGTARTVRLLIVALAMVALFIMLLNLSFVYSRLSNQTSTASTAAAANPNRHHRLHQQLSQQLKARKISRNNQAPTASDATGQNKNRQHHKHHKSWMLGGAPGSLLTLSKNKPQNPSSKAVSNNCQSIDSVNDMLQCYRPDLGKRLLQGIQQRLPKHCYHQRGGNATTTIGPPRVLLHNWTQVQSCLSFVRSPTIRNIHILGERHSGTKFVMQELQKCFPRHSNSNDLKVHRDFVRSKHFFQPLFAEDGDGDNGNAPPDYSSSLIVAVFRDPLDWVEAMRLKPYHAPFHMDRFVGNAQQNEIRPLVWPDFVARPWTMPQPEHYDLLAPTPNAKAGHNNSSSSNVLRNAATTTSCRYGFVSSDVVPCLYNPDSGLVPPNRVRGFEPLYELRRNVLKKTKKKTSARNNQTIATGQPKNPPFDNVLQLRAEKIWHMAVELPLLTPNLGGFLPIRYEDVLQQGMQPIVDWLSQHLGGGASCPRPPAGPQPELLQNRRRTTMSAQYAQWVREHAHVPTEQLLGYFPFDEDSETGPSKLQPPPWRRMALAAEAVAAVA